MSMIKLLLADRSSTIQRIVGMALEEEPIEVLFAGTGEEALSLYQQEQPDIIIADMRLPDMTGIELCRTIRERETMRIPFVLMIGIYDTMQTGSKEAIEAEAREVGVDDVLVKPFDPKELSRKVHDLVSAGAPARDRETLQDTAPKLTAEEEIPEPSVTEAFPAFSEEDVHEAVEPGEREESEGTEKVTEEDATMILSPEDRVRILEEAGVPSSAEEETGVPLEEIEPELLQSSEESPLDALSTLEPEPLEGGEPLSPDVSIPPEPSDFAGETVTMPAVEEFSEFEGSAESISEVESEEIMVSQDEMIEPEDTEVDEAGVEPTIPETPSPEVLTPESEIKESFEEPVEASSETLFMEQPPIPESETDIEAEPPVEPGVFEVEPFEEPLMPEIPGTDAEETAEPPLTEAQPEAEFLEPEGGPSETESTEEAVFPEEVPLDEPFLIEDTEQPDIPLQAVTDGPFDIWESDLDTEETGQETAESEERSAETADVDQRYAVEETQDLDSGTHPLGDEDSSIISEGLKALESDIPDAPPIPEFSLETPSDLPPIPETEQMVEQAESGSEEVDIIRERTLELESAGLAIHGEEESAPSQDVDIVERLIQDERFIDRIVQRVLAKLSRSVVEDIVWQVVPDLAEKLIKEHLKEYGDTRASTDEDLT